MGEAKTGAWTVLGLMVIVNFVNTGFPSYVGPALIPFMANDLRLDRSQVGLIFSAFMLMSGLWGPLVALSIQRWGARATLVAGSIAICAGSLLMAFAATRVWEIVLAYGVLVGWGTGVGGLLVSQTIITRTFTDRRALALSVVIASAALGGVVASPSVSWLALTTDAGWRAGWILLAVLSAGTTLLALTRISEPPAEGNAPAPGHAPAQTSAAGASEAEPTLRDVLRSAPIWPVFMGAIGMSAALSFALSQGPVHLRDLGFSPVTLSAFLSILTGGQLTGTLAAGALADRFSPRLLWVAGLLLLALGLLLLKHPGGAPWVLATAALFGLGVGCAMTGAMSTPADYYGARLYPVLLGIITPLLTIAGAAASYVGGAVFDATGSYDLVFTGIAGILAAAALFLFAVKPRADTAQL